MFSCVYLPVLLLGEYCKASFVTLGVKGFSTMKKKYELKVLYNLIHVSKTETIEADRSILMGLYIDHGF